METRATTGQSAYSVVRASSPFPEFQIAASEYRNTNPDLVVIRWRLEQQREDQAAARRDARGRSVRRILATTAALVCLAVIAVAVYAARLARQYGGHATATTVADASPFAVNAVERTRLRF